MIAILRHPGLTEPSAWAGYVGLNSRRGEHHHGQLAHGMTRIISMNCITDINNYNIFIFQHVFFATIAAKLMQFRQSIVLMMKAMVTQPTLGSSRDGSLKHKQVAAMRAPKNSDLTYMRFLNLVQAVKEKSSFPEIDPVEERVLNILAARWHTGNKVTVLETIAMLGEFSATTLHRRLKSLRKKGMIGVDYDDDDARIKYVVPTKTTREYFSQLGDALAKASLK